MQWTLLHEENIISDTPSLRSFVTEDIHLSPSVLNMTHAMPLPLQDEAHNSLQLFDLFVQHLAPSIKSFVFTIKGVLGKFPLRISVKKIQIGLLLLLPYSIH